MTGWLVGRLIADRMTLLSGRLIANRLSADRLTKAVQPAWRLFANGLTDWQLDDADGQPKMFLSRRKFVFSIRLRRRRLRSNEAWSLLLSRR